MVVAMTMPSWVLRSSCSGGCEEDDIWRGHGEPFGECYLFGWQSGDDTVAASAAAAVVLVAVVVTAVAVMIIIGSVVFLVILV